MWVLISILVSLVSTIPVVCYLGRPGCPGHKILIFLLGYYCRVATGSWRIITVGLQLVPLGSWRVITVGLQLVPLGSWRIITVGLQLVPLGSWRVITVGLQLVPGGSLL